MRRSELRNAPFRETSRKARRKVEPKTGRGEGRSPELFKADRREPCASLLVWSLCSLSLSLSLSGLLWFRGPVVHALLVLWFMHSWSCGSCALGPVVHALLVLWSDLFVGGVCRWRVRATHRRRGLEAQLCRLCGADLRVSARSAGESSPPTREARDQARPR